MPSTVQNSELQNRQGKRAEHILPRWHWLEEIEKWVGLKSPILSGDWGFASCHSFPFVDVPPPKNEKMAQRLMWTLELRTLCLTRYDFWHQLQFEGLVLKLSTNLIFFYTIAKLELKTRQWAREQCLIMNNSRSLLCFVPVLSNCPKVYFFPEIFILSKEKKVWSLVLSESEVNWPENLNIWWNRFGLILN